MPSAFIAQPTLEIKQIGESSVEIRARGGWFDPFMAQIVALLRKYGYGRSIVIEGKRMSVREATRTVVQRLKNNVATLIHFN